MGIVWDSDCIANRFVEGFFKKTFAQNCKALIFNCKKTKQLSFDTTTADDVAIHYGAG